MNKDDTTRKQNPKYTFSIQPIDVMLCSVSMQLLYFCKVLCTLALPFSLCFVTIDCVSDKPAVTSCSLMLADQHRRLFNLVDIILLSKHSEESGSIS